MDLVVMSIDEEKRLLTVTQGNTGTMLYLSFEHWEGLLAMRAEGSR